MSIVSFFKKSKKEKKYLIRKLFFPNKVSNKIYVDYLQEKGLKIGAGTYFFDPCNTIVDIQRPWALSIGEYCKIASGAVILAHDYSRSVLRKKFNDILCEFNETIIGDNVFIGINSIILMGTKIGSNCIVGAGSVVSGSFPNDVVIAGNPAKIICSLEYFYEKRKAKQIAEAKNWVKTFYRRYGRVPKPCELSAFFYLFLPREVNSLDDNNIWYKWNGDNHDEILNSFLSSQPLYSSYEDFIKDALLDEKTN